MPTGEGDNAKQEDHPCPTTRGGGGGGATRPSKKTSRVAGKGGVPCEGRGVQQPCDMYGQYPDRKLSVEGIKARACTMQ